MQIDFNTYLREKIQNIGGKWDRTKLPQIPQKETQAFLKYLKDSGISYRVSSVALADIKPIQSQINTDKVDHLVNNIDKSWKFFVDKDKNLLDGHHRFFALKKALPDFKPTCYILNSSVEKLVPKIHEFDGAIVRNMKEDVDKKSEAELVKDKQKDEMDDIKRRQFQDLQRAKEKDFQDKMNDKVNESYPAFVFYRTLVEQFRSLSPKLLRSLKPSRMIKESSSLKVTFKVSGKMFEGYATISKSPIDAYNLIVYTGLASSKRTIKLEKNIYADDIVRMLEKLIG